VLRLLENEQVAAEEVETALHDGLEYYLEAATEPDFQQAGVPKLSRCMHRCIRCILYSVSMHVWVTA
jgi:hypothetical protein